MRTRAIQQRDYVTVTYNLKDRPFTRYPDLLAGYLVKRYGLTEGKKLLDLGCGRGEFLRGFLRCKLDGYGIDHSTAAKSICPEAKILQSDFDNQVLPYPDDNFDIVFSKSVLEHFYYPERLVKEIFRILKPGGLAITMVPDRLSADHCYYDDYTHRTAFTLNSLWDILFIHGFETVRVEKFRQLPFLWKRPWLQPVSAIISLLAPEILGSRSRLVKFSKNLMLLSSARKPSTK